MDVHAAAMPHPAAPAPGIAYWSSKLDRVVGTAVEAVVAALLLVEIVILGAGVTSRYVFRAPLVWSDELASILFLWLSMLGAVVALRRGEHMRMTGVVARVGPQLRALLEAIALTASIALLVLIFPYALEYAEEERFIVTPALEITNAWRAAAIPVGVGLMPIAAVCRFLQFNALRPALIAIGITFAAVVLLWLAGPALKPLGKLNLIVFFVGVVGLNVFSGVPIAFSFALATFGYLALTTSTPMIVMVGRLDEGMSHLILLAVPLFIFLGALIEMTGMARAMIQFLASLLGHVRGGLSYVLVGAMYLVSGISGSKIADMAAIAPVLFPEMKKRGAKPGDLVALLSATGAQTETIPPSIVLITIGSVTGVSIAALFTGGLLPALVLGLALCVVVWWRYRKEDLGHVPRYSWREIGKLTLIALPALALPFVIRAAVVEGVATATEVSTIGIVYSVLAGLLIYRQFDWRRLTENAGRHRVAHRRDHLHRRLRDGDGLGSDAIGFLAGPGATDGERAGRRLGLPRDVDRRLHHPGQRARRDSRDRAVRAAAVSDRQAGRRARSALRDGGDPRDGHRPVRAAVRRRLLRRLRDQQGQSGRGPEPHLGLHARAAGRSRHRRGLSLDIRSASCNPTRGPVTMSRFFGEIRQAGYVVPDIEAAMDYWSRVLGVGPFFYNERVPIENYRYRGESYEPHNSVALANSGPLQIELIQTPQRRAVDVPRLQAGRAIPACSMSPTGPTDYDADLERLTAQGFKPVMSGEVGERGRFVYFDTEYHPGTVIELSEVAGPKGKMFHLIREAVAKAGTARIPSVRSPISANSEAAVMSDAHSRRPT